jgi:hypothetical protein
LSDPGADPKYPSVVVELTGALTSRFNHDQEIMLLISSSSTLDCDTASLGTPWGFG